MTTKSTPASQPGLSTHRFNDHGYCLDCNANEHEISGHLSCTPSGPSPARSDKDAERDGWLPIATAPRDGSNILIRFGQDGVSQAKYIAGLPHPWQFIDTNDGITWLINHAIDAPGGPSHWSPLTAQSPAGQAKERAKCAECGGWSGRTAELHNAGCSVLAERAPSGETIDEPELRAKLSCIYAAGVAKMDPAGDYERVIAHIDARRATAGTTAAPTGDTQADYNALLEASRNLAGELAVEKALNAGLARELDAARATAGNAAPTELIELIELIESLQKIDSIAQVLLEGGYGKDGDRKAFKDIAGLAQAWIAHKLASKLASNPGASPLDTDQAT